VNLILVGYRGSGKSTVGAILAERLGRRFIDLDQLIVEKARMPIREIFAKEGEAGFRLREHEACQGLRKAKKCVIALGGGALVDAENRTLVRRLGKVVWLRAPAVVLWSRLKGDPETANNRPDLTPNGGLTEIEAKLAEREQAYRAVAHHTIDTISTTLEAVADAIELWFSADDAGKE
jgi:shikimate kinase